MQFGRSDSPFNVVPVDYVVEAIATAASLPEAEGETLHLVDPEPLSAGDLLKLLAEHYGGTGAEGPHPAGGGRRRAQAPARARPASAGPRASRSPTSTTRSFRHAPRGRPAGRKGLTPPNFADYAEPLVRFFKEHENDPAFMPKR